MYSCLRLRVSSIFLSLLRPSSAWSNNTINRLLSQVMHHPKIYDWLRLVWHPIQVFWKWIYNQRKRGMSLNILFQPCIKKRVWVVWRPINFFWMVGESARAVVIIWWWGRARLKKARFYDDPMFCEAWWRFGSIILRYLTFFHRCILAPPVKRHALMKPVMTHCMS